MGIFKSIIIYRKAYKNWFSVLYKQYRIQNNTQNKTIELIKIDLRNGNQTLTVSCGLVSAYAHVLNTTNPKINNVYIHENVLFFSYDGYDIRFVLGNNWDISASFLNEEYNFLNVQGEDVIDIGANIGDTAIFFALKGANRVISLEPYPATFELAQENINFSEFKKKIHLVNAGYGEDKKIKIDSSFVPDNGSEIKESANGVEIDTYSLASLIDRYGINSCVLKMDCEGSEYNLLNEKNEIIKHFSRIQIEYHYGYEKLIAKLKECGFSTKYTEPVKGYNSSSDKTMLIGYIFAEKTVNV